MKKLISILAGLLCVACMTDYGLTTEVEYKNNSSHDILFLSVRQSLSADQQTIIETEEVIATLPKDETYTFHASDTGSKDGYVPFYHIAVANRIAWIQFGDSKKIGFPDSKYGSETIYEIAVEQKRYRKYIYTFTDADYQFALENGTKLEL